MSDQQLHHGNALIGQRSTHERPVAALMHIRSVLDHPPRHRESCFTGGLPWHAAFGNPRQRPVLAVTERGAMELRVADHQLLDPLDVVGVDGLLELTDRLQGFDLGFELGPARKAVLPGNLQLCVGKRRRLTCSDQYSLRSCWTQWTVRFASILTAPRAPCASSAYSARTARNSPKASIDRTSAWLLKGVVLRRSPRRPEPRRPASRIGHAGHGKSPHEADFDPAWLECPHLRQ